MPSRDPQREAESLKRILEVARQLAAPFELRDLLAQVIDAGRDVLSAERGSVFLYDTKTRELHTVVAHGVQEIRFSIDKGIAGECARSRLVINVPDCYADPRFNQAIDKQTGYRTRCMITIPLIGLDDELVGVMQLLNSCHNCFDENDEYLAGLIASQAATAIQRVRLMTDRLERLKLERELDLARKIQMGVLPSSLPDCAGYELASYSNPADETGGDIFDVIAIGNASHDEDDLLDDGTFIMPNAGLFLLLADATGHGIGPALSVTQVRAMLRLGLRLHATLLQLFININSQLAMDLSSDRFVTAFMGVLDPVRHRINYISGGQGPLLHFHAKDKTCSFLEASTVPMGIMDDPPLDVPEPMKLEPGDMAVLLTDGFYEAQNAEGKMMGKTRIGKVVAANCDRSAKEVLDALLKDMAEFVKDAPQLDDVTGLIVKRCVQ